MNLSIEFGALAFGLAAALGAGAASAQAANPADHAAHHPAAAAAPQGAKAEGEVRKVDTALGKITLRHGPIASLDMPAMSMVFTAPDKKILDGVKAGDKVRFVADKQGGAYVVLSIEVVR
jgi:Cu(I)/Ag(I) efflux system protein CusF